MSMLDFAIECGGMVKRSVDLDTGEVIADAVQAGSVYAPCAETARAASASLSTCHNSPQIVMLSGASVMTVKRSRREKVQEGQKDGQERKKRGKVTEFTFGSRRRLLRVVNSTRRDCLPVFVTLTYPFDFPERSEQFKRDLDNFIKRLARKFPDVAGVWKLEPQERLAPHYHLLIWGVEFEALRDFVPYAWCAVVGSDDPNHLLWHEGLLGNSHCVSKVENRRQMNSYLSKYFSKRVKGQCTDWGRWWGVFHRDKLPLGQVVNIPVSEEKAIEFIRYMRRFAKLRSRDYRSLTIICNPDQWVNRLL